MTNVRRLHTMPRGEGVVMNHHRPVFLVLAALMLLGALASCAGVGAQSAPWRIVQSSDGSLYVLKEGARFAVVGEPIGDDELAAYADGGATGAALLLAANG